MRNILLLGAAMAASLAGAAQAYVTVHVETSPTQQAGIMPESCVEDFGNASLGGGDYVSRFGGSGPSATFSGFEAGSQSGAGASFGATPFATAAGEATIKLDRMAKYFGFRTAELDGNNTIELFSNGTSLGYFNLVGSPAQAGFNGTGQSTAYTYVNFFSDTAFDLVRFTQTSGQFRVDDVRVGQVNAIPEPATWGLMILGFGMLGAALRRRAKGVRFA